MRYAAWLMLAFFTITACALASPGYAQSADACVAYGNDKTDFTWRLCPGGEKYERQYLYFGVWSSFYRVSSEAGACNWAASRTSWICPGRTIRCDTRRCGVG
jgi:hypothetical protein